MVMNKRVNNLKEKEKERNVLLLAFNSCAFMFQQNSLISQRCLLKTSKQGFMSMILANLSQNSRNRWLLRFKLRNTSQFTSKKYERFSKEWF